MTKRNNLLLAITVVTGLHIVGRFFRRFDFLLESGRPNAMEKIYLACLVHTQTA